MKLNKQLEFDRETQVQVWSALEALTAPELDLRVQGFEQLAGLDVIRKSPLVVYVLCTRLLEQDIHLRQRIVRSLAELLSLGRGDPPVSGAVLTYLQSYLSQMRKRPIFALLQVADFDPESVVHVEKLLKSCSFAGNQLAEILAERSAPVPIRRQAITFTSQIGFLVAIPAIERIIRRMESRLASEEPSVYSRPSIDDEATLLPYLREALDRLQAL